MYILDTFMIAFGLAMDCFTVAIAAGLLLKVFNMKIVLRMAVVFALFQGLMPLIGYFAGYFFKARIEAIDHWVALLILFVLGVKMIRDGVMSDELDDERLEAIAPLLWSSLLMLAFATSIDALATGIIFVPFGAVSLVITLSIIAFVTFLFTIFGVFIGAKYGDFTELRVEIFGGLVLIGIGVKILVQHMWFS